MTTFAGWSGQVGDAWADEWRRTDRSFAGLSPALDAAILAAAPTGPGRTIDLGCGAGQTSIALATARPDLEVIGVDASPDLVRVATDRARGFPNLRIATADVAREASKIAIGADLLFSRHGVMFFDDPATVFASLRRTVVPGTRLVFSCFRDASRNAFAGALLTAVTGTRAAPPTGYAPGPFGFADADWVGAMLAAGGWVAEPPRPVNYDYVAGEGIDPIQDAAAFFCRIGPVASAIRVAADADRPAMRHRLVAALEPYRSGDRITFPAAAWIWSAHA